MKIKSLLRPGSLPSNPSWSFHTKENWSPGKFSVWFKIMPLTADQSSHLAHGRDQQGERIWEEGGSSRSSNRGSPGQTRQAAHPCWQWPPEPKLLTPSPLLFLQGHVLSERETAFHFKGASLPTFQGLPCRWEFFKTPSKLLVNFIIWKNIFISKPSITFGRESSFYQDI